MRVFVTGGTGLIGKRLLPKLLANGHAVVCLSRKPPAEAIQGIEFVVGDPSIANETWLTKLDTCEAAINLAGEPLFAHRWSKKFKARLWDSRVKSTEIIAKRLAEKPMPNRIFLSGSAIGIYGSRKDEELTETSELGDDFLAQLAKAWEKATERAKESARIVHIRTGIVLDPLGGTLGKMIPLFRFYLGGPLGNGQQWMSWIHYEDMVDGLIFSLNHSSLSGPVNFTAPEPVRNWGFSKSLGEQIHRPSWLPAPGFALRIVLGQVSQVALGSDRVYPNQLLDVGFEFRYPTLGSALKNMLTK